MPRSIDVEKFFLERDEREAQIDLQEKLLARFTLKRETVCREIENLDRKLKEHDEGGILLLIREDEGNSN